MLPPSRSRQYEFRPNKGTIVRGAPDTRWRAQGGGTTRGPNQWSSGAPGSRRQRLQSVACVGQATRRLQVSPAYRWKRRLHPVDMSPSVNPHGQPRKVCCRSRLNPPSESVRRHWRRPVVCELARKIAALVPLSVPAGPTGSDKPPTQHRSSSAGTRARRQRAALTVARWQRRLHTAVDAMRPWCDDFPKPSRAPAPQVRQPGTRWPRRRWPRSRPDRSDGRIHPTVLAVK